jgi:ketol-acid reductoisomerase
MNLLSDAAQSSPRSYPPDVNVILVAPKGSGSTVRTLFEEGRGINSSIAVWQGVTGNAKERATAVGVAIGSGYMYETRFEREVYSDLYGERSVVRYLSHNGTTTDSFFISQRVVFKTRTLDPTQAVEL